MAEDSFINQAGDISMHVVTSHLFSAHARGLEGITEGRASEC